VAEHVSTSYARIADRYEDVRGGAARADALADAVRPWLPPGRVLDVGAGTGIVSAGLARPDVSLVACDLSIEMLARAAEHLPGRVLVADAVALPVPDGVLDAVAYVWVLHHVGDARACLAGAWRSLRPGGRVVSVAGLPLPVDDDLAPSFDALVDVLRPGHRERAAAARPIGVELGFRALHDGAVTVALDVTPNGLADAIEQRLFSHLWDLSDERWRELVEPAVARLRALPEPDRPRRRPYRHPLVVLERP
jgi:SAM-dependent methyltransferase